MKNGLRLVRGNDAYLTVPVRNIVFVRDAEGRMSKSELSVGLGDCSAIEVNVVWKCGIEKSAPFTISGSSLIVKVAAEMDLPLGWYGLEVKYKLSGRQYRSFEHDVFKVVESNSKSYVSGEQWAGEQSYQVDTMYTLMSVIDEEDLLAIVGRTSIYERGTGGYSVQQKGTGAQATGYSSHAEGKDTTASGETAHAEGKATVAAARSSHAEGEGCRANGDVSHAGGIGSVSNGIASMAQGLCAMTTNACEAAFGKYNQSLTGANAADRTMMSVGIGQGEMSRKNGFEVRADGSIFLWMNGEYVRLQDILGEMPGAHNMPNVPTMPDATDAEAEYNHDFVGNFEL